MLPGLPRQPSVIHAAKFLPVLCAIVGAAHLASAQTISSVTVNAANPVAVIPGTGIGVNTAVWDSTLLDTKLPGLVSNAGITALRYPGGSTSDDYNWQTNSIVPNQGGYANPSNTFDAFMSLAKSAGVTPIITVNYGSNPTGTGGGTPALAAAWVAYSNVTKGYGVKYWEIGNEVYGNGEYGGQWETDLHAAHDPTTYGANVVQFAQAMKANDPTIKVGAVLAAPGNWPDGQSPDWNTNVLAQCATAIDFVIVHWYPQNPGTESDQALLGAPQKGIGGSPGIATMVSKLRTLINQYGGANAAKIQILVTEMNSVSSDPGKQTLSVVNSMFIADGMLTWLENGVTSVDVWGLYNGSTAGNTSSSLFGSATYGDYGILSSASSGEPATDTPFPTYYGIQMVSDLGKAGDALVSATSSNSLLSVHAVRQAGGKLAIMLINKDLNNTDTATIALSGYTPAASGTVYSYGPSSSAIASTSIGGLGGSFSVAAAPYSLTTIVLRPASATASYSLSASPNSLTATQGATASSTITVAPVNGFTGSVTYTISGLPSGVTANFSPSASPTSTALTLKVASNAAIGSSVMTVTGTSGSLSASTTVALSVTAAANPGYAVSLNPSLLSVVQGSSGKSTVTITPSGGFNGAVSLSAGGLPGGVTAAFGPATTSTSSTLTLAAASTAATGSSSITITGTSGSLSKSVTLPLTVTAKSSGGGGPAMATGSIGVSGPWFDQDNLVLTNTASITALTLTITAPTTNATFNGIYDTVGSQIVDSHSSGTNLVYNFVLTAGQTLYPGTWIFAAQMGGNGTTRSYAGDTWSLNYTLGGVAYSQSGKF
jgi:hypothetical protein